MYNKINKNELTALLLSTPWLEYVKEDLNPHDEILFITYQGSLLTNLWNQDSDIDIQIYTLYTNRYQCSYSMEYHGIHMHWWYRSIFNFWSLPDDTAYAHFWFSGLYSWKFWTNDDIIYLNAKYQSILNYCLDNKDIISGFGLKAIYEYSHENVSADINKNNNYLPKWNWVWADYYYTQTHKAYDDTYYNGLVQFKHSKQIPLQYRILRDYMKEGYQLFLQQLPQYRDEEFHSIIQQIRHKVKEVNPNVNF